MLIRGCGAHSGIHHKQNRISQINRNLGLQGHRVRNPLSVGLPPTGVNQGEGGGVPVRLIGHPVSGDTGSVLDHRFAAPEDTIHQRRFPHVGAPHHSEDGKCGLGTILTIVILQTSEDVLVVVF